MAKITRPLISIIVPVYNAEKYISNTVESIAAQTYENIEIILIDDGSTDSSLAYCEQIAASDKRIRILRQMNAGASAARNHALDKVRGQYVMFVDADDIVRPELVAGLLADIEASNSDIATCDYRSISLRQVNKFSGNKTGQTRVLNTEEALLHLMYQTEIANSPWAKLFTAHLFKHIRFVDGKVATDLGTLYRVFSLAKSVTTNNYVGYLYVIRRGSIVNSPYSKSRMIGLKFAEEQYEFMQATHPGLIKAAAARQFMEAVFILQKIRSRQIDPDGWTRCIATLREHRGTVLRDKSAPLMQRLYALISYLGIKVMLWTASVKLRIVERLFR